MGKWREETIGDARLILGDCLEILPTLGKVDAVVTDPPYGIGVKYGPHYNDKRADYWDWLRERVSLMVDCGGVVVFTHRVAALSEITDADWVAVWNKPGSFGARVGNSCVLPHWEPVFLYGIHKTGTQSNYASDVITFNPEPAKAGINGIGREKWDDEFYSHPCPKPVGLYSHFLATFAQNAEIICDPFMGSGTTGVACAKLGRRFIGVEIEEKYFSIACRRIEEAYRQADLFIPAPQINTKPPLLPGV